MVLDQVPHRLAYPAPVIDGEGRDPGTGGANGHDGDMGKDVSKDIGERLGPGKV